MYKAISSLGQFPNTLPREQGVLGVYWIIWSLETISCDIIPVAQEDQEIHPCSVMDIENQYLPHNDERVSEIV